MGLWYGAVWGMEGWEMGAGGDGDMAGEGW
jgi:hypothetical protein